MRLFTFGCSYTRWHWPSWADIIARDIGCHYENWAEPGLGNVGIQHKMLECDLKRWLNNYDEELVDFELQHLDRLCDYLDNVETSYEDTDTLIDKHHDLIKFVNQYSHRRSLDVSNIYMKATLVNG